MIGENEARAIAQAYLEQQAAGFVFKFIPTPQRRPNDWGMVFEYITAEGNVMETPIVVLVDKQTGRARTLKEAIKEGWRG